jgi:formylglycine-generating enzyme
VTSGRYKIVAVAIVVGAVGVAVTAGIVRSGADEGARCGEGFVAKGARCIVGSDGRSGIVSCPRPLVATTDGCDAPDVRVLVPAASLFLGPSDWEAEGRVSSRSITVQSFRMDAFEVTIRRWQARPGVGAGAAPPAASEGARAASGMTRDEAEAFCRAEHGDLPTEEQWIAAAASASNPPRRYPWGDTGAVCRRAAWGLAAGPCAWGANGPDTVGAHPDGDSPLGLHDVAGNVAEWVLAPVAVAKGGSWATPIATELRIWSRLELPLGGGDPRVGFRCVYPL